MAWISAIERIYPSKGERGFKSLPTNEKATKVITIRVSEEQFSVLRKALENTSHKSLSDLTRVALLEFLENHNLETTDNTSHISINQLKLNIDKHL